MSSLLDLKPNVPKANIGAYTWVIAGIPKIGKTTLFYELLKTHLKDMSKGILLATEPGYKALSGIIAKDINEWDDFTDAVDELVDKRSDMPFDFIGLDTIDVLVDQCGKVVLREWNRDNKPEDRKRTYQDIGYGRGHEKVRDKIMPELRRLINAGYGLFIITHSKEKKVKQKGGDDYDQLQPSLPGQTGTAIENLADFLVFATSTQEAGGSSKRWLHFRNDGYIKAGGRFINVPDKVEFSLDNLLTVFKDAVKGSFDGDVDVAAIAAEQAVEAKVQAQEFVENEKVLNTPEGLVAAIDAKVKAMDADHQGEVAAEFKNIAGTVSYKKVKDVEHLKLMLAACG